MAANEYLDSLQLSAEKMRELGYRVVDMLVDHFDRLPSEPVATVPSRRALEEKLREPIPERGVDIDAVLQRVEQDVLGNMMHVDHRRFFAFIPSPSNYVSVMADALATGFNVFAGTWLEGAGPAQIEMVTVDWLRELCGMPEGTGGLFVSGGSMANLTALVVARQAKLPNGIDKATVYCSEQTHASIEKGMRILGFRSDQLRKLDADREFRLPLTTLLSAVASDRSAGKRPFCVVANAGTTNTGAVDPLSDIADFCRDQNLWFHVDGAYGGAAVLSKRAASRLAGIGRADSLSLDPHKWLFQPYETGCVLVREGRRLGESFRIAPEYLKDAETKEEEVNFYEQGIQMTRSFRALKLWMSLQVFGLERFRNAIDRGISLAETAEELLRRSSCWEIVTPAEMGIVTFRYRHRGGAADEDALNRRIVEGMTADGFAMLNSTVLEGRTALHLCTINPRTTVSDLEKTVERMEVLGSRALNP